MNLQKKIEHEFQKQMEALDDHTIGLAVSGGGDSMAMLNLASEWANLKKKVIKVVTVNHNLRNEAKKDASKAETITEKKLENLQEKK